MTTGHSGDAVRIGEWLVDPSLDTISRGAETHKLEPRTMRLLMCLAESGGTVVSLDRLLTEVWSGVVVGSASVYQAVSQLRKLLGDVDPDPTYIATIPRKGYRLIASVTRCDGSKLTRRATDLPAIAPPAILATPPVPVPRRGARSLIIGGVVLIVCLGTALLLWRRFHVADLPEDFAVSIVVLPFVDMSVDKANQAFCDGLTEELSNWLAQIPTLRVVARTSAFAFRGQGEDVRKIGKALGTNRVLEGSMRRSGDRLRITVQLIDAGSGFHLWSQDFDRPMEDAINVQEDISRSVAGTMQVRLTSDSERQFAARRTTDSRAYQMFLLARHDSQLLTPESTERAIVLYRQVLSADPKFAPAYTELAYGYLNQGYFHGAPITEVAAQVEPLVDAALRLDDRLSAAYAVRGALRASQTRTTAALDDLQHAVTLNPSDMGAIAEMGRIWLFEGRPHESLASYDRAAALDPLNFTLQEQRCTVLMDLARYDEAKTACERARVLQPAASSPADRLAWVAESRGLIDEALRWNAAAVKAEPSDEFDLYWSRAGFLLSVGMADAARTVVEDGRSATKDEFADTALVRVIYREGGADALRSFVESKHLDDSPHALTLFETAYARLLLGDAPAVRKLLMRALAAPDVVPGFAEQPFYARGERAMGTAYRLDLAASELALGDRPAALKDLQMVLSTIDKMIAAGVERYATYELRAKVLALEGRGDEAMRDLGKAAQMGWRRSWWATHEPYFASLQARSDFRTLVAQVNRSNDQLVEKIRIQSQPPDRL